MTALLTKIQTYFKGAFSEIKKVTWPTRKQTIVYSLIVIIMSVSVAVFFSILDYIFNQGLDAIVR